MKDIKGIIIRTGKWSLIIAIVIIALEHWKVFGFNLNQFPISIDWFYGYLLLNGGAAGPFAYLEHRKVKPKICPQCDNPLHTIRSYSCPKCGNLQFKIQDTGVNDGG